ncbi:hypothetical protein N665_0816s0005 [Sinapis alba]|nr:hypothetical protein N665_0816s0005 [Sinapis alba]
MTSYFTSSFANLLIAAVVADHNFIASLPTVSSSICSSRLCGSLRESLPVCFSDNINRKSSSNCFWDALHDDEYEELKESRLGVFLKFKELDFGWTSRLVHYMLCFQLNIKKKYEPWSLVGADPVRFSLIEFEHLTDLNCEYIENLENLRCEVTKEIVSLWERIGVSIDVGPSSEQIIRAYQRCQE